ncbi:MAG TPA: dihydrofolate reductase family protein [Nitrososphaera sp.]|jgi:dihydrofolate reductase|nr:dihydrofolate reductase family protein [Nitrososphaera sp.]
MRKVIQHMMVSLDGFIEGPNGEADWMGYPFDDGMHRYFEELLNSVDILLFGRVAYEEMIAYWPSATTDPQFQRMNDLPKVIFSKTLSKVEWNNARLVKDNINEEVLEMKQQPGKNLLLTGASVGSTFRRLGLIDEYWLIVRPIVLGSGKPLFNDIKDRLSLRLLNAKTLGMGNVLLCYEPQKKAKKTVTQEIGKKISSRM